LLSASSERRLLIRARRRRAVNESCAHAPVILSEEAGRV
jgi:hypothetical protein